MAQRNTYFQDEKVEKDKIDFKNLRRLMRYAVPYKKLFILVLIIMPVAVASSMITPLLLRFIIDRVIPDENYRLYFLALGGFLLAGLAEIIITFFQQRSLGRMGHSIIADIRKDIFINCRLCRSTTLITGPPVKSSCA